MAAIYLKYFKWLVLSSLILILTGCQFSEMPHESQRHSVKGNDSADMSATGHVVLLVTNDNKLEMWDTYHYAPISMWTGTVDFPAKITRVAVSPSGQYAAIATQQRLTVWDIHTNQPGGYWQAPAPLTTFVLSNDGRHALVNTEDKQAYYVDVKRNKIIWPFKHSDQITAVALSKDGHYALTGARDDTAILWDLRNGRPVHTWDHPTRITNVAISPDNRYVMTAAYNDKVRIWDLDTGKLHQIVDTLPIIVSDAVFSPNNRYLAIGTNPQILYVWDLQKNQLVKQWVLPKEKPWKSTAIRIHAVDFSDDSTQVMTEDSSGHYHVWLLD